MSSRHYAKIKEEQRRAAERRIQVLASLEKLSPGKPSSVNSFVVEKQTRWDGEAHVVTFLVGTAGGQTQSMTFDQAVNHVTGGGVR